MMRFLALLLATISAACSSTARLDAPPPQPITCRAGPDCDAKWSRAIAWVAVNSRWKIQTQTDLLVQTFSSTEGSPNPSYTVTKTAGADGLYEISLNGGCDNFIGCNPAIPEARAKFADFVAIEPPAKR
jgi:hypothetical protein